MRLGVHISMQGGLNEALKRARALGCDTMQIFSRNPRGWGGAAAFDPRELAVFAAAREKERFSPLVVHVPYLINLASPDDTIYAKSVESFTGDIKVSGEIGAEYFVTHLGSHRGSGEKIGIERFAAALNKAFSAVAPGVMVLLETTAGAGDSIGSKFEHIEAIVRKVRQPERLGVCLDTAHIHAAGYDIRTKKGVAATLKEFDRVLGMDRLKVIHLNDSKGELGSHLDRHEHIGKGTIGTSGMKAVVTYPALKDLTFILETPKETDDSDRENLAVVRGFLKKGSE